MKKTLICSYCGWELSINARFCRHCGRVIQQSFIQSQQTRDTKIFVSCLVIVFLLMAILPVLIRQQGTVFRSPSTSCENLSESPSVFEKIFTWPSRGNSTSCSDLPATDCNRRRGVPRSDFTDQSGQENQTILEGEILYVNAPSSVEENQVFTVSVGMKNKGPAKIFRIEMHTARDIQRREILLEREESKDVTFDLKLARGEEEIFVTLYANGKFIDNKSIKIKVLYVDGRILEVQMPDKVEEGQMTEIPVVIMNTGTKNAEFEIHLGELVERIYLNADSSGTVTFSRKFRRRESQIEVSLWFNDLVLDKRTVNFTVLYPELVLSLEKKSTDWVRDENDLPRAKVTVEYRIWNKGTGTARDVNVTVTTNGKASQWQISTIPPSQTYVADFEVTTLPVWQQIQGVSFLTGFELEVEMVAEVLEEQKQAFLSTVVPRSELESDSRYASYISPYLVTPNDPVVKSTLERVLSQKKPWDPRSIEDYLADWVSGGILGFGKGAGVVYDQEKTNTANWFRIYGFWSQLPRETIARGKGVCIDQAVLYATLLRAYGYSPDDVYVVVGIPLQRIQEAFGLEVTGHAWVVYKRKILGKDFWVLAEVTSGGINRLVCSVLGPLWDSLIRFLGFRGYELYLGSYAFNDVNFKRLEGGQSSPHENGVVVIPSIRIISENGIVGAEVQLTIDSLRMSGSIPSNFWVDGNPEPINLFILTKSRSGQAVETLFRNMGYFTSWVRSGLRRLQNVYPAKDFEFFKEFWVKGHRLQFHVRGAYLRETQLGHLWAFTGHLEYSDKDVVNHLRGKRISYELAEASDVIEWPHVKWESFEKDVRIKWRMDNCWTVNIRFGVGQCYEEQDDYDFSDGVVPVVVFTTVF